ncbi:MAG: hypothetical protein GY754_35260 [bacterium]|nr:hypothetical protein [bacterium]
MLKTKFFYCMASMVLVTVVAFSGCEAGLQSSGDSNDSSNDSGSGFSFSDMYSNINRLQEQVDSLKITTEEQEIIISNLDSSQSTSITALGNSIDALETNLQTTDNNKNYFSGNVGIGTSNPLQSLHFEQEDSSIYLGTGTGAGVNAVFGDGNTVFAGEGKVSIIADCNQNGTPGESILFGGGFTGSSYSKGTATSTLWPNGVPLVEWMRLIRGTLTVSGAVNAVSFAQTSDIRYKKDITPLTGSLDKILSLRGVTYNWKTKQFKEKNFSKKRQIGFIAQDVEKIVPELVQTDEKGYKSVSYSQFSVLLVEAVKELKEENSRLKQQVASLKSMNNRVVALEKRLKNDSSRTAFNYR